MNRNHNVFSETHKYNIETGDVIMAIIDMAKAHLQNVSQRIEELQKQQQLLQSEINQLTTYLTECLKEVQEFEKSNSNTEGDKR